MANKNDIEAKDKYLAESIFDPFVDQFSPTCPTYEQVPVYDKSGDIHYEQKEQDLKGLIESNGSAFDWQLEAMLKAGVEIASNIHTGNSDRLSVEHDMQAVSSEIESSINEKTEE